MVCALSNKQRLASLFRLVLDAELLEHGKIVVGFFQVVSPMSDVLSISLKDKMPRLHEISQLANPLFLSLQDFVNLHCLPAFDSFYPNWILDTFCVPFFMFMLVLLNYLRERRQGLEASGRARTICFTVGFLIYPRVSKHIFGMLNCRSLSETESWLERDYAVDCESGTYQFFFVFAGALVVVIPLGVPICLLLVMARQTAQNYNNFNHDSAGDFWAGNQDNLFKRYEMLVRVYRPGAFFFEPVDWLRKMMLGGLLMLLHRGSILQVFVGTCISVTFLSLHMVMLPYRKWPTNCLKACVEIQVFLTLFIGVLLRFSDRLGSEILDVSGYQTMVVTTFFLLIPGAFVVTTVLTVRMSRRERSEQTALGLEEPLQFSTAEAASG